MQSSYRTYEEAKSDLLAEGFTRYIDPIMGAERFGKPEAVDPMAGGFAKLCIATIQHHWVSPKWGDEGNYFTLRFW